MAALANEKSQEMVCCTIARGHKNHGLLQAPRNPPYLVSFPSKKSLNFLVLVIFRGKNQPKKSQTSLTTEGVSPTAPHRKRRSLRNHQQLLILGGCGDAGGLAGGSGRVAAGDFSLKQKITQEKTQTNRNQKPHPLKNHGIPKSRPTTQMKEHLFQRPERMICLRLP